MGSPISTWFLKMWGEHYFSCSTVQTCWWKLIQSARTIILLNYSAVSIYGNPMRQLWILISMMISVKVNFLRTSSHTETAVAMFKHHFLPAICSVVWAHFLPAICSVVWALRVRLYSDFDHPCEMRELKSEKLAGFSYKLFSLTQLLF